MAAWKVVTKEIDGEKVRGIMLPAVDPDATNHEPTAMYGGTMEERFMPFQPAGKRVEAKAIYTVKMLKLDGSVVQVGLEDQINNNVAAPSTFLGLHPYVRKGFTIFFDAGTGVGAFCPTWGCWAEWDKKADGGYCSETHQKITVGDTGEAPAGFGAGATTSRSWGSG